MDVDLTPLSEPDEETLSPVGISAELVFPGTLTDPGSLSVTTPDHLLSEHILGSIPLWEAKGRPTGAERHFLPLPRRPHQHPRRRQTRARPHRRRRLRRRQQP